MMKNIYVILAVGLIILLVRLAPNQYVSGQVINPPTATIKVLPTLSNIRFALSWSSTDATSCQVFRGGVIFSVGTSGNFSSGALPTTTVFSITCIGLGGTATNQVTAIVN